MIIITTIPKKAGIYKLTCEKNGKIYIGKSVNLYYRLSNHKSCEKKSKGRSYLENAVIKYGWSSFNVEILEIMDNFDKMTDNDNILKKESYYIELFNATNASKGYNLCKYSTDRTGVRHSEDFKKNMSLRQTGRKLSDETKEKIRQSRLGKSGTPHTEEHKERMRQLNLGRKMLPEDVEKLRQARLGTKASEDTKMKMSISQSGRKHSDETKAKMGAWQKGKPKSKEHVEKMRLRVISDETRLKISQARKNYHARQKLNNQNLTADV